MLVEWAVGRPEEGETEMGQVGEHHVTHGEHVHTRQGQRHHRRVRRRVGHLDDHLKWEHLVCYITTFMFNKRDREIDTLFFFTNEVF